MRRISTNKFVFQMEADEAEFFRAVIVTAYVDQTKDIMIGEELIELTVDKKLVRN